MQCHCGAANCSGWIGLKPSAEDDTSPKGGKNQKGKKGKKRKKEEAALEPPAVDADVDVSRQRADGAAVLATEGGDEVDGAEEVQPPPAKRAKPKKPKYLRRVEEPVADEDLEAGAADAGAPVPEVADPRRHVADAQLHSFGAPLPNVWVMKATGAWEEFEEKRAEEERARQEIEAAELRRVEAKRAANLRLAVREWAEQPLLACVRECHVHRFSAAGTVEELRDRIARHVVDGPEGLAEEERAGLDDEVIAVMTATLKKELQKLNMKMVQAACRERFIWPGGHMPQLRDRLVRFDTGLPLSEAELVADDGTADQEQPLEESEDEDERAARLELLAERRAAAAAFRALTPEQQAAVKAAEVEAKAEDRRQLAATRAARRAAPPELPAAADGEGPVQLVDYKLPRQLSDGWKHAANDPDKRRPGTGLPTEPELRSWNRAAQAAYWDFRFRQ